MLQQYCSTTRQFSVTFSLWCLLRLLSSKLWHRVVLDCFKRCAATAFRCEKCSLLVCIDNCKDYRHWDPWDGTGNGQVRVSPTRTYPPAWLHTEDWISCSLMLRRLSHISSTCKFWRWLHLDNSSLAVDMCSQRPPNTWQPLLQILPCSLRKCTVVC